MARHPRRPRGLAAASEHARTVHAAAATLLDGGELAGLERVQKVVCEPTRAQIIRALGVGPLSVQDLAHLLNRPQPATSQHLRVLRQVGVVEVEPRGRQCYYHLSAGPVAAAVARLLANVARAT